MTIPESARESIAYAWDFQRERNVLSLVLLLYVEVMTMIDPYQLLLHMIA
jgi:hypothetical protein